MGDAAAINYRKKTVTTCTDTTQASCRDNQKLHNTLTAVLAQGAADTMYDGAPHSGGEQKEIKGGGRIRSEEAFTSEFLWAPLLVAGTLAIIYGIVK
jgi:hypothetical protein